MLADNVLSDKSVSNMEMKWRYSSGVLGVFWASAIWSNVVARLLSVIGHRSRMRFLTSRNSRALAEVWIVVLSESAC